MELKLLNHDNTITKKSFDDFIKDVKSNSFFYFHKETSYKDLKNLIDKLEEKGYGVYFREVKYALDEGSYIYELHII